MLKLEDVYDVVVAKDGQEAYDMVRESMAKGQFFNLIFMDIQVSSAGRRKWIEANSCRCLTSMA